MQDKFEKELRKLQQNTSLIAFDYFKEKAEENHKQYAIEMKRVLDEFDEMK